jgi:hypothetical protein
MENHSISFFDHVRIRDTPPTRVAGLVGLSGTVYGITTPSITEVYVIGEVQNDYAINVYFEERNESFWFASDQLEFLDHNEESEFTINGKKWIRTKSGEWEEQPGGKKYPDIWERIMGRIFKKRS